MERISTVSAMQARAKALRLNGRRIGLIPTMGYLHEGHLSLIDEAKKYSDITVLSIFVNPAQFAPNEDYNNYPGDIERDVSLAEKRGVDIVFYPSVEEMYPDKQLTWINVETITEVLCGANREGHFRGVSTVVTKLFNIVKPHVAVFGQKDAQQAAVIQKMVDDLNMDVMIHIAPIVREPDGLAMSSRNIRLTPEDRKNAVILSQVLFRAKEGILKGESIHSVLAAAIKDIQAVAHAELEYIEARSYPDLEPMTDFNNDLLIALATHFGNVRLIDNILIEKSS